MHLFSGCICSPANLKTAGGPRVPHGPPLPGIDPTPAAGAPTPLRGAGRSRLDAAVPDRGEHMLCAPERGLRTVVAGPHDTRGFRRRLRQRLHQQGREEAEEGGAAEARDQRDEIVAVSTLGGESNALMMREIFLNKELCKICGEGV